jgi:ribosome-binding factor A
MSRGQREPSQRQLRVGEELRHMIASILERGDIRDGDVAGRPVTVTEVTVSPDLRNATVFVVPLGGGDVASLLAGLKRAKPFLRHELARKVQLRLVPDLAFASIMPAGSMPCCTAPKCSATWGWKTLATRTIGRSKTMKGRTMGPEPSSSTGSWHHGA